MYGIIWVNLIKRGVFEVTCVIGKMSVLPSDICSKRCFIANLVLTLLKPVWVKFGITKTRLGKFFLKFFISDDTPDKLEGAVHK